MGMLVVIILGILCCGGCHGQSKWYEQQPGQSDWFEQKQRETDNRFQQFNKEWEEKRKEMQRDSEEFHDRFDKAREEMRRNWEEDDKFGEMWENGLIFKIIGGIAVFFFFFILQLYF